MSERQLCVTSSGGLCPVQSEGTINGVPYYFRARHDSWQLWIHPTEPVLADPDDPDTFYATAHYDPEGTGHSAGYMSQETVRTLLWWATAAYAEWQRGASKEAHDA